MSRPRRIPSYRLHKPSGQARVIINGKHIYLGRFGTPESWEEYIRPGSNVTTNLSGTKTFSPVRGLRALQGHGLPGS
jgi:hypothetical protein